VITSGCPPQRRRHIWADERATAHYPILSSHCVRFPDLDSNRCHLCVRWLPNERHFESSANIDLLSISSAAEAGLQSSLKVSGVVDYASQTNQLDNTLTFSSWRSDATAARRKPLYSRLTMALDRSSLFLPSGRALPFLAPSSFPSIASRRRARVTPAAVPRLYEWGGLFGCGIGFRELGEREPRGGALHMLQVQALASMSGPPLGSPEIVRISLAALAAPRPAVPYDRAMQPGEVFYPLRCAMPESSTNSVTRVHGVSASTMQRIAVGGF